MVRACLREKAGIFYIVVSYYDEQRKRKQIWISTKLKAKSNKRKARAMLNEYKYYYDIEKRELVYPPVIQHENNIIGNSYLTEIFSKEEKKTKDQLFGDYIYQWNEDNKNSLQATTYAG